MERRSGHWRFEIGMLKARDLGWFRRSAFEEKNEKEKALQLSISMLSGTHQTVSKCCPCTPNVRHDEIQQPRILLPRDS